MQERVVTWPRASKWVIFGFAAVWLFLLLVGAPIGLVYTYPYDSLGRVVLGLVFLLLAGLFAWRLGRVYRDRGCRGKLVIGEAGLRVRDNRDALIPWSSVERIGAADLFLVRFVEVWFAEPEGFDPGPNRLFGPGFRKKKGKRVVGFATDYYGISPGEFAGELAQRVGLDPAAFAPAGAETPHWRDSVRRLAIYSNAVIVGINVLAAAVVSVVLSDDEGFSPLLRYAGMFAMVGLLNLGGLFVRGEHVLHQSLRIAASLQSVLFAAVSLLWVVPIVASKEEWSLSDWIASAWFGLFSAACVLTVVALVRLSKKDVTVPSGGSTAAAVVSPGSESE